MRMSDEKRRHRVVVRHHLGKTASDVLEAVRGVAALHSSDPVTPFLAARARVDGFVVGDLEAALYEKRSLWRMHAMRRTLFVVPADEVAVFEAGAARDVARKERLRLERWLSDEDSPAEAREWLQAVSALVLEVFAGGGELKTQEVATAVPEISRTISVGSGRWATTTPVAPRLLFLLAMEGHIVRTRTAGTWRASQYGWAAADVWAGAPVEALDEEEGRVRLTERYLATHGPVTVTDLRWWTGWTAAHAKAALAALEAATVELDSGGIGYLLADDTAPVGARPTTVAFLPGLDPSPMGWKERDWYLGGHGPRLFDSNGNAGPSVWVDGAIVGGWAQRADGVVVYELLEDVESGLADQVAEEARRLTEWLNGTVVTPRFRTPLERQLSG